jgi:hypothetical protein
MASKSHSSAAERAMVLLAALTASFAVAWSVTHLAYVHQGTVGFAAFTALVAVGAYFTLIVVSAYVAVDDTIVFGNSTVGGVVAIFTSSFVADSFAYRLIGW